MNREQQRFQAAVAAMKQLLIPENFVGVLEGAAAKKMDIGKALAMTCIDLADALIAELDRTKPEPETPKADADGWIPHKPGDPMPLFDDEIEVRYRNGETENGYTYSFCWGKQFPFSPEYSIIAWKPAE